VLSEAAVQMMHSYWNFFKRIVFDLKLDTNLPHSTGL